MHKQLQGIESILKVVWIVNHQNKFLTRLHLCIIFVIFLDIRLEASALLKMNLLIGIFKVFWLLQFYLATLRAAIFKKTSFSQNTFNGCFRFTLFFSCSMIQNKMRELIKLEAAYLLHGRCYCLHIFITRNFKKIQNNIKHIVL